MSISFNKVIMVGRTTRVPEVKMTAGLTKVANFTYLILVEGRLEIDKWVDKSGINREKPKIYVSSFRFLETKSSKEENTNMNENVFEEVKQEEKEVVQDKLFDDFERWLDDFE